MSALMHTPPHEKAPLVHTGCEPLGNSPSPHPPPRRRPLLPHPPRPANITARAVKNLITKKFWHSVSLVLVAIYRPEFSLSPSPPPPLFLSPTSSCNPFHRLLISPFHPLFLPLEGSSLAMVARICGLFEPASNHTPPPPPSCRPLCSPPPHLPFARPAAPVPIGRPRFL